MVDLHSPDGTTLLRYILPSGSSQTDERNPRAAPSTSCRHPGGQREPSPSETNRSPMPETRSHGRPPKARLPYASWIATGSLEIAVKQGVAWSDGLSRGGRASGLRAPLSQLPCLGKFQELAPGRAETAFGEVLVASLGCQGHALPWASSRLTTRDMVNASRRGRGRQHPPSRWRRWWRIIVSGWTAD